MNIKKIMSKNIITKDINSPIWEIARVMDEYNIGFIPITDKNKIIGVITDRDICIRCLQKNNDLQKSINDFITRDVITINIDDNISEALRIMADKKIKRLMVKDNKKIVGILTLSDIINHYDTISELLPTLKAIWTIEKNDFESDVKVNSYEL